MLRVKAPRRRFSLFRAPRLGFVLLGFVLLAATALLANTAPAGAQAIIVFNHSIARDCYLFAKMGSNLKRGIEICDDALSHEPLSRHDRAATYDNRGVMKKILGQEDAALADYNKAIEIDDRLADTYINRGAILIAQKKYEAALDDINKALAMGVEQPHIGYYDRGLAEHMLGRYQEAYFDYKRALELRPDFQLAQDMLKYFVVKRVPARTPG
jgi:tetratricopeptide (TPR) repeat protein